VVERLLQEVAGDALCDACLAFAAEAALMDMRQATEALPRLRAGVERGPGHCESCGRETLVTALGVATDVKNGVSEYAARRD
jgi:hypothetical protein